MEKTLRHRLGAASGLLFVAIFVTGFFGVAPSNPPEFGTASAEEIRGFLDANRTRLLAQAILSVLAWTMFVLFIARLRAVIAIGDESLWLSWAAFGSGLLTAGLFIAFHGFLSEFATADLAGSDDATILTRWVLIDASYALFGATTFLRAAFLATVSLASMTARALPRWLAWSGLVVALVNFLDGFELLARQGIPLFDFALFLLWVAIASLVLVMKRGAIAARPE